MMSQFCAPLSLNEMRRIQVTTLRQAKGMPLTVLQDSQVMKASCQSTVDSVECGQYNSNVT